MATSTVGERTHTWAPRTVAALFTVSGVVHLVRPLIPRPTTNRLTAPGH